MMMQHTFPLFWYSKSASDDDIKHNAVQYKDIKKSASEDDQTYFPFSIIEIWKCIRIWRNIDFHPVYKGSKSASDNDATHNSNHNIEIKTNFLSVESKNLN